MSPERDRRHRHRQESERRALALLAALRERLPSEELEEMESLVVAGEPGVGFENLCTQLYEHDVVLQLAELHELSMLGGRMGIEPRYWERLSAS